MYDLIWSAAEETQRIPCVINFETSYIYKTLRKYGMKIMGYCNECCNKILIRSKQNPITDSFDNLKLEVKSYDSIGLPHDLKRKLIGEERERVLQQMMNKQRLQWRNEKAGLLIKNNVEPAHLYNLDCLQRVRFQARIRKIGIKYFKNIFESLEDLKNSPNYGHIIHDAGFDKFYVFYVLPEQIDFYKDFVK